MWKEKWAKKKIVVLVWFGRNTLGESVLEASKLYTFCTWMQAKENEQGQKMKGEDVRESSFNRCVYVYILNALFI